MFYFVAAYNDLLLSQDRRKRTDGPVLTGVIVSIPKYHSVVVNGARI